MMLNRWLHKTSDPNSLQVSMEVSGNGQLRIQTENQWEGIFPPGIVFVVHKTQVHMGSDPRCIVFNGLWGTLIAGNSCSAEGESNHLEIPSV